MILNYQFLYENSILKLTEKLMRKILNLLQGCRYLLYQINYFAKLTIINIKQYLKLKIVIVIFEFLIETLL